MSVTKDKTTPLELLEEARDLLLEKRNNAKHMNTIAIDIAKANHVEKQVIMRCKDYLYYRGAGWGDTPISPKDPEEKFPDRVSPTFRKLLQIIEDVNEIGQPEILDVYLDAMKAVGVEIKITGKATKVSDIDDVKQAIENMKSYQSKICQLADEINIGCTELSEDIGFTPKKEFKGVLGFFDRIEMKRDVDDTYQQKVTDLEMTTTAYNDTYDGSLK